MSATREPCQWARYGRDRAEAVARVMRVRDRARQLLKELADQARIRASLEQQKALIRDFPRTFQAPDRTPLAEKFGDHYLFTEYDWADHASFGTAIPLRLIDAELPTGDEELLNWLARQEDEHRAEIDAAWDVILPGRRKI